MSTNKKRVLIGLFGLSRTFKTTSNALFERIINPNSNDFEFDIVINTDFESNVLTAYRKDNVGPISKYKYDDVDTLRDELTTSYNRDGQLKEIMIYNRETNFLVYPWFVVYKRMQQILKNRHDNNETYDIYIMLRLDVMIDRILKLNEVNNEMILMSGWLKRDFYLHDRDVADCALYGNREPFMYWMYSTIKYYESITNLKMESIEFFERGRFCDDETIQKYTTNELLRNKTCESDEIFQVLDLVHLKHTDCAIMDHYNYNNSIVPYDFHKYYGLSNDHLIRNFLYNMKSILQFATFQLSENRNGIIFYIIR
jgi:hypothetical protein